MRLRPAFFVGPFAFALALWMGVLSQFIPTVGTYIGGAVPILVALMEGVWPSVWVLIFVIVYQQFENYLLQPRITARTLDMHPAVAFGSVLAGVAVLGGPGALLALPMGASMQAFLSTYIRYYEVEEHPLLPATKTKRTSVVTSKKDRDDPESAVGSDPQEEDDREEP